MAATTWRVADGALVRIFPGQENTLWDVTFKHDGRLRRGSKDQAVKSKEREEASGEGGPRINYLDSRLQPGRETAGQWM